MKKVLGAAVLAGLVTGALAVAGTAGASSIVNSPALDCAKASAGQTCVRWCYIEEGGNSRHPCGVNNPPSWSLSGTYSYTVPMDAATQSATGVAGDPGATGTANITLDLTNNRFCATTSWSNVHSKVVAGHIHQGGYGEPENPAVWIALMTPDFLNGVSSPVSYCETAPAAELRAIVKCPAKFHTVVHSMNHPAGAIRGQIGTTCSLP
jgi:hypothetical protein